MKSPHYRFALPFLFLFYLLIGSKFFINPVKATEVDSQSRVGEKHIVTKGEIRRFLQDQDPQGVRHFYDPKMGLDPTGAITAEGNLGAYTYKVEPGHENDPANFIKGFLAARYGNYKENGSPSLLENPDATEYGAYRIRDELFDGATDSDPKESLSELTHRAPLEWMPYARYQIAEESISTPAINLSDKQKDEILNNYLDEFILIDYHAEIPLPDMNLNEIKQKISDQVFDESDEIDQAIIDENNNTPLLKESGPPDNVIQGPPPIDQPEKMPKQDKNLENKKGNRIVDTMEMVEVGDVCNPNDPLHLVDTPQSHSIGGVNYHYKIGKFPITVKQWCVFLNSVARRGDLFHLCPKSLTGHTSLPNLIDVFKPGASIVPSFEKDPKYQGHLLINEDTPIIREDCNDEDGNKYFYRVRPGYENFPITLIGPFAMFRFCNWIQNGCPQGDEGIHTTESGSYKISTEVAQYTFCFYSNSHSKQASQNTENTYYFPLNYNNYLFISDLRPPKDNYDCYQDAYNNFCKNAQGGVVKMTMLLLSNEKVDSEAFDGINWTSSGKWRLPSSSEWYKAAFYDPKSKNPSLFKDVAENHYWNYATCHDEMPTNYTPEESPLLNTIHGGANYIIDGPHPYPNYQKDNPETNHPHLTPVGSFSTTTSHYGAYDMQGNIYEALHVHTKLYSGNVLVREFLDLVGGSYTNETNMAISDLYNQSPGSYPYSRKGNVSVPFPLLCDIFCGELSAPDIGFRLVYHDPDDTPSLAENSSAALALFWDDLKYIIPVIKHPDGIFRIFQYMGGSFMNQILTQGILAKMILFPSNGLITRTIVEIMDKTVGGLKRLLNTVYTNSTNVTISIQYDLQVWNAKSTYIKEMHDLQEQYKKHMNADGTFNNVQKYMEYSSKKEAIDLKKTRSEAQALYDKISSLYYTDKNGNIYRGWPARRLESIDLINNEFDVQLAHYKKELDKGKISQAVYDKSEYRTELARYSKLVEKEGELRKKALKSLEFLFYQHELTLDNLSDQLKIVSSRSADGLKAAAKRRYDASIAYQNAQKKRGTIDVAEFKSNSLNAEMEYKDTISEIGTIEYAFSLQKLLFMRQETEKQFKEIEETMSSYATTPSPQSEEACRQLECVIQLRMEALIGELNDLEQRLLTAENRGELTGEQVHNIRYNLISVEKSAEAAGEAKDSIEEAVEETAIILFDHNSMANASGFTPDTLDNVSGLNTERAACINLYERIMRKVKPIALKKYRESLKNKSEKTKEAEADIDKQVAAEDAKIDKEMEELTKLPNPGVESNSWYRSFFSWFRWKNNSYVNENEAIAGLADVEVEQIGIGTITALTGGIVVPFLMGGLLAYRMFEYSRIAAAENPNVDPYLGERTAIGITTTAIWDLYANVKEVNNVLRRL